MSLILDRRDEFADEPGIHALIVGISRYRYLPRPGEDPTEDQRAYGMDLEQLTASALTAQRLGRWLLKAQDALFLPLVTCRMLLAPQPGELDDNLDVPEKGADFEDFLRAAKSWREDSSAHPDGMTFFYFAGHGVSRRHDDDVMVFGNVGDGLGDTLRAGAEVSAFMSGMAPQKEFPNIARHQLYFFDECRTEVRTPPGREKPQCSAVFPVPQLEADNRNRAWFFTTEPGSAAYAITGDETAFGKALLMCLEELESVAVQEDDTWSITAESLKRGVEYYLHLVDEEFQVKQVVGTTTYGKVQLKKLTSPPLIDVDVYLTPEQNADVATLRVSDDGLIEQGTYGPPVAPLPYRLQLHAGTPYLVEGVIAGTDPTRRLWQARWPHSSTTPDVLRLDWPLEAL